LDLVRLIPLGTSVTNWPIVPAPDDKYGTFGGMRIGRGNLSTVRKLAPVPQSPHDFTWNRTRTAAMGNLLLTAWAIKIGGRITYWTLPPKRTPFQTGIDR
jgi:hypothetical protein